MFSWQSTTKRLFLRPSSNFLDFFFHFVYFDFLISFYLFVLNLVNVITTPSRTNGQSWRQVCIESINLGDTRYTRTHAQDTAQHTRRHVRAEGVVALRQGRWRCFTSLLYFTQGAKMGRRKQSGTRDSRQCFYGRRSWRDRFATAALKSLNGMNIKFKICVFSAAFNFSDHSKIKARYL